MIMNISVNVVLRLLVCGLVGRYKHSTGT